MTHQSQDQNTYEQIIEQPHTTAFQSQNNHFFRPTMSRQLGSLHRSNSHPTNLTSPIPIIPLFAFPPPDFPSSNVTSGMNSDTNSHISVLYSISQLNNPNIETPDEFADSEPSPSNHFHNSSNFSQPPFQPILSNNPDPITSTPSYASQVTPTYSSLHSDQSSHSPDTPRISPELDNFITLQQQPYHLHTPTINQISSTINSSNPPTPTPSSNYTESLAPSSTSTESSHNTNRAYRTFKRKFPNHPFPAKPGTAREYINHPKHTNTKEFLAITLPSFPQYTLNTPHDTNETRNFVDEYVLMPTLSWTSYYHFTNPLCLPLSNTHIDIERNTDMLYRLTTPLTARQFTYVGYKKSLKTHTAPRANEYTLEYYDHNIIRANQDQFLDDDRFANPQITEKFFIKTPYIFTLNIFDRKFDHIISEALTDTQAYESFKERFQIFSLTFHFLAPHERDLHCSHDIMLRTKQTHTYSYYRFIQNHFDLHTPSRQPHHRFQFINSKYTSPFFLNFTYCIKDTNLHGILRNYDPITQMYIFCPITKTFNAEESRPFLIPHEFVQPIEIPILEFIHNTKFNHKLYNLIQNTPYEFAVGTEELTTIKALQLLWPLLQTENIIRILAKLLTTSELIHDIFPHGFFPDD